MRGPLDGGIGMDKHGEQMAEDAFEALLRHVGAGKSTWTPGNDPPDLHLSIGQRQFAVEVTRAMQFTEIGDVARSEHGWVAALSRFAREVEHAARAQRILNGAYGMQLVPVNDFRTIRPDVVKRAVAYIQRTADVPVAPRARLARGSHGHMMTIEKVGPEGDFVGGNISIGHAKRAPRILSDLETILTECIDKKKAKLASANVSQPWILLVIDSYSYGEAEHWDDIVRTSHVSDFHTVARIHGYGRCQVLASEAIDWRAAV